MYGEADLSQRVNGCNFEVEAGIFADDLTKFREERVNPGDSIDSSKIADSVNSHSSNCWDPIFEIVEEKRFKVFSK